MDTNIKPTGLTLNAVKKQASATFMPILGMGLDSAINRKVGKNSLMYHGARTGLYILAQFIPAIPKTFKHILAGAAVGSTIHVIKAVTAEGGKLPESIAAPIRKVTPTLSGTATPVSQILANQPAAPRQHVDPFMVLNGADDFDMSAAYNLGFAV